MRTKLLGKLLGLESLGMERSGGNHPEWNCSGGLTQWAELTWDESLYPERNYSGRVTQRNDSLGTNHPNETVPNGRKRATKGGMNGETGNGSENVEMGNQNRSKSRKLGPPNRKLEVETQNRNRKWTPEAHWQPKLESGRWKSEVVSEIRKWKPEVGSQNQKPGSQKPEIGNQSWNPEVVSGLWKWKPEGGTQSGFGLQKWKPKIGNQNRKPEVGGQNRKPEVKNQRWKPTTGNPKVGAQKWEPKTGIQKLEAESGNLKPETKPQNPKVGNQKWKPRQVANRRRSTTEFPAQLAGR